MAGIIIDMDKQHWYARQKARLAYRRGCNRARQGNHQSAISILTKCLVDHPKAANVYIARGLSYRALGQLDLAQQDFMAASSDTPAIAYFYLGQLCCDQGSAAEALSHWQTAIEAQPNYADAHHQMGLLHHEFENWPQALASFNRVLTINPNLAEAYLKRGHVRQQLGDLKGAMADWQLAKLNDASLADTVPEIAKPDGLAAVKKALQEALHPFDVLVKQQGKTLEISLRRQVGEGISYFTLPEQIRDLLLPLELSEITQFNLVGYVGNGRGPEWENRYDLYQDKPCPPCHWPTALATLVTFPPMGLTALLYARQVKQFYYRGQYPDALRASKAVKRLSLVGTGAMCVLAAFPLMYTAVTSIQNEPTPPVRTAKVNPYDIFSN